MRNLQDEQKVGDNESPSIEELHVHRIHIDKAVGLGISDNLSCDLNHALHGREKNCYESEQVSCIQLTAGC